jgi:hypothetical protein
MKTTKNKYSRPLSQELEAGPPEYEEGVIIPQLRVQWQHLDPKLSSAENRTPVIYPTTSHIIELSQEQKTSPPKSTAVFITAPVYT